VTKPMVFMGLGIVLIPEPMGLGIDLIPEPMGLGEKGSFIRNAKHAKGT